MHLPQFVHELFKLFTHQKLEFCGAQSTSSLGRRSMKIHEAFKSFTRALRAQLATAATYLPQQKPLLQTNGEKIKNDPLEENLVEM